MQRFQLKRKAVGSGGSRKRVRMLPFSRRPRSEIKYYDTGNSGGITNAATVRVLGYVAEGSDSVNRVGRRIQPVSLDFQQTVYRNANDAYIRSVDVLHGNVISP